MRQHIPLILIMALLCSCANETGSSRRLAAGLEEVDAVTILPAPEPQAGTYAPDMRGLIERGKYMVEVLGCGTCHSAGALDGVPDPSLSLAGSKTGIAYTNPMGDDKPGVVYPPNITPDEDTGIGTWSDQQIANAIRSGIGGHNMRPIVVMPWPGYSGLRDDDTDALVYYLRSIKPVRHRVPENVEPGQDARYPFVYFGVYRSND